MSCTQGRALAVLVISILIALAVRLWGRWYDRHATGSSSWDWPTIGALLAPLGFALIIIAAGRVFGPLYDWPALSWLLRC